MNEPITSKRDIYSRKRNCVRGLFITAIKEKNAAYLAKQFSKCIYFRNTQIQGSHLY